MAKGPVFRLFGPLEVADGSGHALDLGTRKQRALVAMLALEPGRVVSLDRLIDELWAGEPPAQATRTLQAYIAHLRKVLEPGRAPRTPPSVLLTREPGYQLAVPPGRIDLWRFTAWVDEGREALARDAYTEAVETLDRALGLWRGDPLGEFADQEFARPAAARLTELRAAALEDRFDARLALGEAASLVPGLEALVEDGPYRERAWSLLVLALYRAGRQADALAALRRVKARLSDDLGLRPGPELQELERAVFEQSPGLRLPPREAQRRPLGEAASVTVPSATAASVTATSVVAGTEPNVDGLVARSAQMVLVERCLGEARRGRGGVVLVTGEAGIGKTRLVRAAADLAAARGFRLAWGRCVDGTAPAFWPWRQIVREAGDESGLLAAQTLSPAPNAPAPNATAPNATAPNATAPNALAPNAPAPDFPVPDSPGQDPDAALFALFEQVADVLTRDETPLTIVLDDLHWADVSSLRLLSFVADAAVRHRLLVFVTCRPEPGDHPAALRDTLAELSRSAERVELSPFTADDVASYLRVKGVTEEPGLVEALLDRTGGNPFYLGEVLRLRGSEGTVPSGARDVIERRVARLPEETRALLRAAAVAGRDVAIDVLETVTDMTPEQVMTAMEPAIATGLLVEPPAGETPSAPDYRFAHALVREALYAGLSRLERSRLHLRVGEALEPVLPEAESATLAHHFAQAAKLGGTDRTARADKAVEHACRAARHATGQLAHTEAVDLWALALSVLPPGRDAERARIRTELGQARRTVGRPEEARRDWEDAVRIARAIGDRDALIPAVTAIGGPSLWNWRPYGVVDGEMVAIIEDLLAGPLADADRAALLGALALELHYGPRSAEGERHAAEAVEIARKAGDVPLLARTLNNYLLAAFRPGRNTERRAAAEELANLPGLPVSGEVMARVFLMSCLLRDGDVPGWDRELARCETLLDAAPRPELESMVRVAQTARSTLDGRWDEAEALLAHDMQFGSTLWGSRFRRLVTTFTCRRAQGRVPEMLDELVAAAEEPLLVPLRPVAVLAAVEADRPALAHELIGRWGTGIPDDWVADFLLPVWGLVAARLGTPDPGDLYRRLLPYADQFVVAGMGTACWGSTHLVLAELAHRTGDDDAARDHTRAARDVHKQ
ncbi:BTAD domain-containing putative transcriptional regulator [Spirillospora sp. NPDC048819]|uniref:BTAD domain-containing putative transcriptional regulator n=1 Tax=Spirillospora sp. NPDC048819 TaxID=3155268 RepID=UPI0033DA8C5D